MTIFKLFLFLYILKRSNILKNNDIDKILRDALDMIFSPLNLISDKSNLILKTTE